MSKPKKFMGFWITVIVFLGVLPILYYLLSNVVDQLVGWTPISMLRINLFIAAFLAVFGLFWISWASSETTGVRLSKHRLRFGHVQISLQWCRHAARTEPRPPVSARGPRQKSLVSVPHWPAGGGRTGYSFLHFVGKGSPVEAFGLALYPTQSLVTTGPYAYTRNPMVLGLLFILLAVAFAMGSVSGLVMIPIWWVLGALYMRRFEEPVLARRFGERYEEYRRSVPEITPRLIGKG